MELKTDQALVRPWRSGDEEALVRHLDDYEVWRNLRDIIPHPYTLADAREWIGSNAGQNPVLHFAIEIEGVAAGGIGLIAGEEAGTLEAEIGYWLGRAFWGRGIMTGVVRVVADYAFTTLGMTDLYACIFGDNIASAQVLEKAGFHLDSRIKEAVIKEGRLRDQFRYVRMAGDDRPADPMMATDA